MAKFNIEIPTGKRTRKYRLLEILPGALSYLIVFLLFFLSWLNPLAGVIFVLVLVASTFVKAIGVAFRTAQGYKTVQAAEKVDWHQRFLDLANPHEAYNRLHEEKLGDHDPDEYNFNEHMQNLKVWASSKHADSMEPDQIYHAVIMTAYDEGLDVLTPSVEAVRDTEFPNDHIVYVLAYEERGGEEMEQNAKALAEKFDGVFKDFLLVKHPSDLPNEIKGKGPNLTYAGYKLSEYVRKQKKIKPENVIVTSLDSDNRMSPKYLDHVAYEFLVRPGKRRQKCSYQPVSLFMNNIWEAAAPMRVVAISNSFFNVINTMRPHLLRNFASHSQPLVALEEMKYWSKHTIVEDGHQFWRSLFHFKGDYEVIPIRVPIYQDAVMAETFWKTVKAQFIQVRRWDYGASDVAYVGNYLFSKEREMPFWPLFTKFVRLLDGHVTLAIMAPIVAFGGWVPMLLNMTARGNVAWNLPNVVGTIQTIAMVGVATTVIFSLKMLPKRPEGHHKARGIFMVLQWVLMPVIAILYQSVAAFYAQTRLMTGHYMEKFDVTKKVVKK